MKRSIAYDLDKLRKLAGKKKAAIALVEALYNNGTGIVTTSKLREIDAACKLSSDYPNTFGCNRMDYSNDHVFYVKAGA